MPPSQSVTVTADGVTVVQDTSQVVDGKLIGSVVVRM